MILIVDYGIGNLSSVKNMLSKAGSESMISNNPRDILVASKVILPGVGNFDYGINKLTESGFIEPLERHVKELKKDILGICLGAQLLGKGSEEGDKEGLGWLDMECKKFIPNENFKVPHMGWEEIEVEKESRMFNINLKHRRFYFVHSYYMVCYNPVDILATSFHGAEFTSAVQSENIYGVQFHPEKSLNHGLNFMKEFSEIF
jgi:glutamine amidotransferase